MDVSESSLLVSYSFDHLTDDVAAVGVCRRAQVAPEMAVKMYTFDSIKGVLSEAKGALTPGERFVAGGLSGALAQAVVSDCCMVVGELRRCYER